MWEVLSFSNLMHQSIPPAPSPHPGYCGAFARLVSSGGWHLQIFCPGTGHSPAPGPFPRFWHARGFLSEYNDTEGFTEKKKQIGSSVKDRNKLKRDVKGMFSILCMQVFIAYQARITLRNWSHGCWSKFFCYWINFCWYHLKNILSYS